MRQRHRGERMREMTNEMGQRHVTREREREKERDGTET